MSPAAAAKVGVGGSAWRGGQSKPDNEPAGGGSAVVYVVLRPSREPALAGGARGPLIAPVEGRSRHVGPIAEQAAAETGIAVAQWRARALAITHR